MNHNVINLKLISKTDAKTKNVVSIDLPEIIFFADDGDTNLLCGSCEAILANGITIGNLSDIVLKCNECESFNEVPDIKPAKKPGNFNASNN